MVWIDVLQEMWVYVAILLIFATVCFYFMINKNVGYITKLVAIPVLLMCAFYSFVIMGDALGYAYPSRIPDGKFILHGYTVQSNQQGERSITTFIQMIGEPRPRLYVFPYDPSTEKTFAAVKKKQQKGVKMIGEVKRVVRGPSNTERVQEFTFYKFPHQELLPKDN